MRLVAFITASLLALLAGSAVPAVAQTSDAKPVLVVSVASADKLLANLDTLGSIAESKLLTDLAKAKAMAVLQGVDRKRPLGVVVTAQDGGGFQSLGFVPVSDFAKLAETLRAGPA